jgi:deoxyribonuclease IV
MPRIGAHMSVAGGLACAVDRAALHGCETLQIFTKNASRWRGRPLEREAVREFRTRLDATSIAPVVSHASYLINLATTVPALREQSIAAFVDEIDRARTLGLLGVVIHPGTCTAGTEDEALRLIADAIRLGLRTHPRAPTMVLLEHTAGQGRTLGHRFEHLAAILAHLDGAPRVGVCLDTCHLLAAGYDLRSDTGYEETFGAFDRLVGLDRLRVVHANDSKRPLGSRVDRHAHIGDGHLGVEAFRRLVRDPRVAGLPLILETEKAANTSRPGVITIDPYDVRNLETLRGLRSGAPAPTADAKATRRDVGGRARTPSRRQVATGVRQRD